MGNYVGSYVINALGTYGPGDGQGVANLNGNLYVKSTATLSWIHVSGGKIYIDAGPTGVVTLYHVQGDIEVISGTTTGQ
ncbi:hypothetical protein CD798_08585 [Bacillaceae bacterium SAOS 7]|nr:hypothetical protein CD798_08585 [Bacillaceae bacterium SAOS 7]